EAGRVFIPIGLAADAVGVALQSHRAIAQMRQQVRRDADVVVDHLCFGELRAGIEQLVEAGEADGVAIQCDGGCFAGGSLRAWHRSMESAVTRLAGTRRRRDGRAWSEHASRGGEVYWPRGPICLRWNRLAKVG